MRLGDWKMGGEGENGRRKGGKVLVIGMFT
jgi:hypothetical protein